MQTRHVKHPLGDSHPDNLGFGYIVEDGTEHSDNPLHPTENGICPFCDQPHQKKIEQRHVDNGGFIYHCHNCATDYFVRAFKVPKVEIREVPIEDAPKEDIQHKYIERVNVDGN